ncbi:MAG: hypothetical protein MI919_08395 [Holophagales bacterium]|nr:hypothetical protein [Holophagales bacterium]
MRSSVSPAGRLVPLGVAARRWPRLAVHKLLRLPPVPFCRRLVLDSSWQLLVEGCAREPGPAVAITGRHGAWALALRATFLYLGTELPADLASLDPADRSLARLASRPADGARSPAGSTTPLVYVASLPEEHSGRLATPAPIRLFAELTPGARVHLRAAV